VKDFTLIVAANSKTEIAYSGSFIRVKSSNGALTFSTGAANVEMQQGDWSRLPEFKAGELYAENKTGAAVTATVTIGSGDAGSSLVVGAVDVSVGTTFTSSADVALASAATGLLLAAASTRRAAIISNPSSNPREIRIGDTGAGAAEGIPIAPGATIELKTTAAISAYNPHTAAMSIAVAEVLG